MTEDRSLRIRFYRWIFEIIGFTYRLLIGAKYHLNFLLIIGITYIIYRAQW